MNILAMAIYFDFMSSTFIFAITLPLIYIPLLSFISITLLKDYFFQMYVCMELQARILKQHVSVNCQKIDEFSLDLCKIS